MRNLFIGKRYVYSSNLVIKHFMLIDILTPKAKDSNSKMNCEVFFENYNFLGRMTMYLFKVYVTGNVPDKFGKKSMVCCFVMFR